jgi:carbamoyl-phosphate synthase large subunit
VVKIPRFTFEKFPSTEDYLTTSMKSVGETMAIGRTFKEALQKGVRSLETGFPGLGKYFYADRPDREDQLAGLRRACSTRIFKVRRALLSGISQKEIVEATSIDPWFLDQIQQIIDLERELKQAGLEHSVSAGNAAMVALLKKAKKNGFSDRQLATLWKKSEGDIRKLRKDAGIVPTYKLVDTCAAEFEAYTPYFYSTYEKENEARKSQGHKVVILGGGPNRIGQGIEFDYCCVHASYALQEMGVESIMVNSNPETVSTDYDTSDRLYFEPLTEEDVLNIIEQEQPDGVIVQFGGQTPLNLAVALQRAGVTILGTSPDSIDRAEDRERFQALIKKLDLLQPENGTALSVEEAVTIAQRITYPVVVRPSYVLGGRAMEIVYDETDLRTYFREAVVVSPEHPILVDKFLENAIEMDVDALSDGDDCYVAGVMEHIEEAGIHSGDSACVLPPHTVDDEFVYEIRRQTKALAKELGVVGLMNIQFAVKDNRIYIIEVNPRASRTVPFVSKATGVPLARFATKILWGQKLQDLDPWSLRKSGYYSVKEAVLPFDRFPGVDVILGPEMRSTGEVMGIDSSLGLAYMKSLMAAGLYLPTSGTIFISVNDKDKIGIIESAKIFKDLGFRIMATRGTATSFAEHGVETVLVNKVYEGRPNVVDAIKNGEIQFVINTSSGKKTIQDSSALRQAAVLYGLPYSTTLTGAKAMAFAVKKRSCCEMEVKSLQEYYSDSELKRRLM